MAAPVSVLEKLSLEDRDRILGWLDLHPTRKVVEMVAQEPPDGLGIHTHKTTLRRFAARHRAETRGDEADLARLFAQPDSKQPMDDATQSLVTEWAFEMASSPRRKTVAFKAISRWILKQRELDQREREIKLLTDRLALDREKFEFNAARQAIIHHAAIETIATDHTKDNEDKIRAVRLQLFGSAPA